MTGFELLVVALLIVFAGLLVSFLRTVGQRNTSDLREGMDPDSRSLYAPIKRLVSEIEEAVRRHSGSSAVKVVGGEAVQEAHRIRDQVARALVARSELKRAMRERNVAAADAETLRAQIDAADDLTREALASALEAKKLELSHYVEVEATIKKIDVGVTQARAALEEMKTRLAVKGANESASLATEDEGLREAVGRMRSLSISYDEVEELLRD